MKNKYLYDDKKIIFNKVCEKYISQAGSAFRKFPFFACHKQKKHEKHK